MLAKGVSILYHWGSGKVSVGGGTKIPWGFCFQALDVQG